MLEKDITFFINHLKNIFQIKRTSIQKIQNILVTGREISEEEESSLVNLNNRMTLQGTEIVNGKKDEELMINSSFGNDSKLLERKESKSSNFSKYSKNSQHQILKMEKENEEKDNLIKLLMSGLHKKIIFYNEKEKKEYLLMIPNEEIQFESIIKLFFIKYPTLNQKDGGSYTYKNKTINLKDKVEINENDKIIF